MGDFVPLKKKRTEEAGSPSVTTWPPPRLCQRCKRTFDPRDKNAVCVYHTEDYSGETAQRWLEPGANGGRGGEIHYFWTCCGKGDYHAEGCRVDRHLTYDEDAPVLRSQQPQ